MSKGAARKLVGQHRCKYFMWQELHAVVMYNKIRGGLGDTCAGPSSIPNLRFMSLKIMPSDVFVAARSVVSAEVTEGVYATDESSVDSEDAHIFSLRPCGIMQFTSAEL